MIREFTFKGTKAIEISNNHARVTILPRIGGKIASFYLIEKDFELLYQNPDDLYKEAQVGDDFGDYDTSGFDDCFPNIDSSIENLALDKESNLYKKVIYPDHGELWSSRFDYHIPDKTSESVELTYTSKMLSYTFRKSVTLKENHLMISYAITNHNQVALHGFYTVHCLAKCEESMEIDLGSDVHEIINVSDSKYLGKVGTLHSYPITRDTKGNTYPLNQIFPQSAKKYEKYYATSKIKSGLCSLYYPSSDVLFSIKYDPIKFPYIGFWVTEGGYKYSYNCALEPSSGYYDSMTTARLNNKYNTIKPGQTFSFDLKLSLSSTK